MIQAYRYKKEAAKPRQRQQAVGFRTYLQDESEDFVTTGLGIGESGQHHYHGLSLPNKEGFESLQTLAGLGPVTLSSEGVLPSVTAAVNGEDLNLTCEYHRGASTKANILKMFRSKVKKSAGHLT